MAQKNKKINIDYIGVVKENDGKFIYERVDIAKSEVLLADLEAIYKNPNRTVLEMQDLFKTYFDTKTYSKSNFPWCLPYSYSSSYIDSICYPYMIEISKYMSDREKLIVDTKNEISENMERADVVKRLSDEEIDQAIDKKVRQWDSNLKVTFWYDAVRYIRATDFSRLSQKLKGDKSILVMSNEAKGKNKQTYRLSEDLTISTYTNFCYGISTHFDVNVRYKDIDLITYSHLVKYYYAGVSEIIKCTRSYGADRDNWEQALLFISDVANQVKVGDLSFVKGWLKNEITEMLSRLYAINHNPIGVMEDIKGRPIDIGGLCKVYAMDGDDIKLLDIYPEEMGITFKASKLSSALDLIDRLRSSSEVYEPALDAVVQIEDINRLLAPELNEWMVKISDKLAQLDSKLKPSEEQLKLINEQIQKHDVKIRVLYDEQKVKNITRKQVDEEYRKSNPELIELEKEKRVLEEYVYKLQGDIRNRKEFLDTLNRCYRRIEEAGLLSA